MKINEFSYPLKMGLCFFMAHFWLFFFLLRVTSESQKWNAITRLAMIVCDFPIVFLTFGGTIHYFLWQKNFLWEIFALIIGSMFYYAIGWLYGNNRMMAKQMRNKNDPMESM